MVREFESLQSPPKGVNPKVEPTAFEANRKEPCPLCARDHFCYLFSNGQQLIKAVCQWTDESPSGWDRTGTAKDGRGIFTNRSAPQDRKFFPKFISLTPRTCGGEKHWDDPYWRAEIPHWTDTGIKEPNGPKEQVIHYEYPAVDTSPLGRVERVQWTDRRKVYMKGHKTKLVFPKYWVPSSEGGAWINGKGDRPWPLYREQEAMEEILKGGTVFAVGGEQAVEAYRSLGLCAVTCQGGESNYRQIIERLSETFTAAKVDKRRALLVIHPDHDLTGEKTFAEGMVRECYDKRIPAAAIEPLELWPECPPGGDIYDFVTKTKLNPTAIIATLETAISAAVDRQELEILGRKQRARWRAPEAWQGELGTWKTIQKGDDESTVFSPLCDFDFQIERELISDGGGGLMLQVKRTDDRAQRRVYIQSQDYSSVAKFMDAIKKGLGGGIICNLTNYQLQALIRVRLHEYRSTRQGKAYRLADRVGQQSDGTWVFKQVQFTANGEPIDESRSLWVWNSSICDETGGFKPPHIAAQNPEALKRLVNCLQRATGSNFPVSMLVMGAAAAGVHYQAIQEIEGAFPIVNNYGDPGGGKTTAAEAALAMVGQHQEGVMRSVSVSAAYERLKLAGGLMHCLDDPERTPELDEFLKGFYNGNSRIVRGRDAQGFNIQKPHSPLLVTSNHACGENSAATQSRLVRLFFPKVKDGDSAAFQELKALYPESSGALTQLIKLGYPKEEVYSLESELREHLPHAHQRIAKSLALVLYYAQQVAILGDVDPAPIKTYVVDVVCGQVNDPDEDGDSLRDFLEKLFVLQSEAKVGDWNCRMVNREDGRWLALYLPGVWTQMDKAFHPAYNRKIIESLLVSRGIRKTRQRFHSNEDESRAYQRAKLTQSINSDLNPPETTIRWCFEVPYSLLQGESEKVGGVFAINKDQQGVNDPQSTSEQENSLLINAINRDQQRSTEINKPGPKSETDDPLLISVDLCDLKDQQVLEVGGAPENGSVTNVDGNSDPCCTLLISLIDKCAPSEKNALLPEIGTGPAQLAQLAHVPVVGSMYVPKVTALWVRHQDSTKLPYRDLKPSLKDAKEIALTEMPYSLREQFLTAAKVIKLSRDGTKAFVIHQVSARKACYYLDDLVALPEEASHANG
jgi:hypothetical protein